MNEEKSHEWSLVLTAMGIEHSIIRSVSGWLITVDEFRQRDAEEQVRLYEKENADPPIMETELIRYERYFPILFPVLLYLFHAYLVNSLAGHEWVEVGNASSRKILQGEWWRCVTALTLHSDLAHLLSNIFFGTIAATALCQQTGKGLGWFLILMSGAMGNFGNALLYGTMPHRSIGASTAVFGAIGILGSFRVFAKDMPNRWKAWVYFAGAMGLLGFIGSGGERTDISAHLFGFAAGIILGIILAIIKKLDELDEPAQFFLAGAGFVIITLCWLMALQVI